MTPTITNKHGLPEALVRAVRNDPYTGGGDISVTKLIDSPQRRQLWRQHEADIEEDVSERIWSLQLPALGADDQLRDADVRCARGIRVILYRPHQRLG